MPSVAHTPTPDDPSTALEQPEEKPMTKTSEPLVHDHTVHDSVRSEWRFVTSIRHTSYIVTNYPSD